MAVTVFHDSEGRSVLRQDVRAPSWIKLVFFGGACLVLLALLSRILGLAAAAGRNGRRPG